MTSQVADQEIGKNEHENHNENNLQGVSYYAAAAYVFVTNLSRFRPFLRMDIDCNT